jgi:hypothetical protein
MAADLWPSGRADGILFPMTAGQSPTRAERAMDWDELEIELLALAERLDVEVRHVRYEGDGGLCVMRGRRVLMVNDLIDLPDRVDGIARALAGLPSLDDVFVPPAVREVLEGRRSD